MIMHVLAPSLTPRSGWYGRNGRSGKLSYSSDVIGTRLICMYVCVAPPIVGVTAWLMAMAAV